MLHNHCRRNNRLCEQKCQESKGFRQAKKSTKKKSCRKLKGIFQMYMAGKKTTTNNHKKFKRQKQLKSCVHLIQKLIEFSSRSANFFFDLSA